MPTSVTERVIADPSWGNWKLERDPVGFDNEPLLVHTPSHYRVDFHLMDTPAGLIDIIFQVVGKVYSSEDLGDFIKALDDLLAPQTNLGLEAKGSFNALGCVVASIWPEIISKQSN
jgi:hypothetical protein